MSKRSMRAMVGVSITVLAGLMVLLGLEWAAHPATAQDTTTTEPPPTTTEPPPTTTEPEPPPTTTEPPPPTSQAPPTTQGQSTTTTQPATTTSSSTTSSTSTSTSTTSTTVAPVQITPPAAPPTEEIDAGGGGGGLSSDAKVGIVVGGLLAVGAFIGFLTFLYWRRTRPARYDVALDALAEISASPTTTVATVGPIPVIPGGDSAGKAVAPDPDGNGDGNLLIPVVPSDDMDGKAAPDSDGDGNLLFPPRSEEVGPVLELGDKPLFPPRTGEQPPVILPEPPPPIVTLEDLQLGDHENPTDGEAGDSGDG